MVVGGGISVVIADDYRLIRESLRLVLSGKNSIQIVGEAATGSETINLVDERKPDVAVLNIIMPDMGGIEIVQPIIEKSPKTKPLILTQGMDETMIFKTLKAGAKGYISRGASIFDLIKAIEGVHRGELWVERKVISRFFEQEADVDSTRQGEQGETKELLTPREKEILGCLATGCTNKEIGESLFISEKTVKTHLNSIFRKLNVSGRLQAILHAINKGLT
jgi:DNA-binding NarL/FixJ family response regulator